MTTASEAREALRRALCRHAVAERIREVAKAHLVSVAELRDSEAGQALRIDLDALENAARVTLAEALQRSAECDRAVREARHDLRMLECRGRAIASATLLSLAWDDADSVRH